MSGKLINVSPKQDYTFNQPISTTTVFPLGARAYQSIDCVSGILLVRAFSQSLVTGSSLVFKLNTGIITPDDPTTLYGSTTPVATLTINAADTNFPRLYTAAWTGSTAGWMVAVVMNCVYGTTTGSSTISGLAVDLILRDS